jgi:hypothetical protein
LQQNHLQPLKSKNARIFKPIKLENSRLFSCCLWSNQNKNNNARAGSEF